MANTISRFYTFDQGAPFEAGQRLELERIIDFLIDRIDRTANAAAGESGDGGLDKALEVEAELDTHIGSSTVHGVSGVVVGTSGAQTISSKTLESSTVGVTSPAEGNFDPLLVKTSLDRDLRVPVDRCLLACGPFDINAELVLDGGMVIV